MRRQGGHARLRVHSQDHRGLSGQCPHPARWAVPTPSSRLSCAPSFRMNARGGRGDAGAPRPRPSPKSLRLSGLSFGGDWNKAERPGSRRASRACRGHGAQRARRDAEHARLPLSVTAAAVTPSPPGKGLGCARSGGAPLRSPRFAWGDARSTMVERGGDLLRRPTEVTPAPPAMGRVRGVAHPYWMYRKRRTRIHSQADHNSKRGTRGQRPPGPARPRRASPFARRDPCKRGAPVARRAFAQSARHSHARTV